jgi:hypothetical protein
MRGHATRLPAAAGGMRPNYVLAARRVTALLTTAQTGMQKVAGAEKGLARPCQIHGSGGGVDGGPVLAPVSGEVDMVAGIDSYAGAPIEMHIGKESVGGGRSGVCCAMSKLPAMP